MRYAIAVIAAALALVTGCARPPGGQSAPAGQASAQTAGVRGADIYQQVLRQYVSTPSDNSFPGTTFKTIYVLDLAYPDVGNPTGQTGSGVPITREAQAQIVAGLATLGTVKFVSDRDSVLDKSNGCAVVKDGGILVTLGTIDGDDKEVKVGVFGYVACLGATWLTYVVQNPAGSGWTVTGTTGSRAIA